MTERKVPIISVRKKPKQARANSLVARVLDAAVQVLRAEGASRFTIARVAERAGASVGSIYQYFPNKASILFQLQADEWQQTATIMRDILADGTRTPQERIRRLVHAFIASECDEAQIRTALDDVAPSYRHAPELEAVRADGIAVFRSFIAQALPHVSAQNHDLVSRLLLRTLSQVGSNFSEEHKPSDQIATFADALADMFTAYLNQLVNHSTLSTPA